VCCSSVCLGLTGWLSSGQRSARTWVMSATGRISHKKCHVLRFFQNQDHAAELDQSPSDTQEDTICSWCIIIIYRRRIQGAVQGVRTPALLIRVPFLKRTYLAVCSYSVNHGECIKTNHFDIKNAQILSEGGGTASSPDPRPLGAFGARPPVPLLDGLDTRPCKILDPPLYIN